MMLYRCNQVITEQLAKRSFYFKVMLLLIIMITIIIILDDNDCAYRFCFFRFSIHNLPCIAWCAYKRYNVLLTISTDSFYLRYIIQRYLTIKKRIPFKSPDRILLLRL